MLTLLLVLQLGFGSPAATVQSSSRPDSSLRAQVDSAIIAFQLEWREAWMQTSYTRPSLFAGERPLDEDLRGLAVHCHWQPPSGIIRRHIVGGTDAHASCPLWLPRDGPTVDDERYGIDRGLTPLLRLKIRALRRPLRLLIDSAARQFPSDVRIAGQRLRFALDDADLEASVAAALDCDGDHAQCSLFHGLVLYNFGSVADADSAFMAAARMMAESERCAWTNIADLLEADTRRAYESMSCAERNELDTRLWWLADPLFIEPGNERRAEHFARKVLVRLRSALGDDERQHYRAAHGGDAIVETLVRYGWPSHLYWGGPMVDNGHNGWLLQNGAASAQPYIVREYSRERLHVLPMKHALSSPLQATPDDWQLTAPTDDDWWPVEHYARDASRLVQLPEGQSVMLRRQSATRFVWAGNLDASTLTRAPGDSVKAVLFQSRSATDLAGVAAFGGQVSKTLVIDAPLLAGATLLGIEIPGDSTRAAARTRFGVEILPPLASLAGARALSVPLLDQPSDDATNALDSDAATRHMFGSTTFAGIRRIGVYWEGYGFAATDTIDLELRLNREDRPGLIARAAGAIGLGGDDGTNVDIRWREAPGSGRAIQRSEGSVPVQMRSIVLDVARLERGTYTLQLSMQRVGGLPETSKRTLVLR